MLTQHPLSCPADTSQNALHRHLFGYNITEIADQRSGYQPENKPYPPLPPNDRPKPDPAQQLAELDAAAVAWAESAAKESQIRSSYGPPYVQPAFTLAPGCVLVNGACPCSVSQTRPTFACSQCIMMLMARNEAHSHCQACAFCWTLFLCAAARSVFVALYINTKFTDLNVDVDANHHVLVCVTPGIEHR